MVNFTKFLLFKSNSSEFYLVRSIVYGLYPLSSLQLLIFNYINARYNVLRNIVRDFQCQVGIIF